MTMLYMLTITALCLLANVAAHSDSLALGKAFYIPSKNVLGDKLVGGTHFFTMSDDCMTKYTQSGITSSSAIYFSNAENFYDFVGISASIGGSLRSAFTLGATLDGTTKHISGRTRKISGTTVHHYAESALEYLTASCFQSALINPEVIKAFEKLPRLDTKDVSHSAAWRDYHRFFLLYGSHIVKQVFYGSSMYQHTFAKETSEYTEQSYRAKACLDLAGPTQVGKLDIAACAGITKEQYEKAKSMSTSSLLILRGGKLSTRAALQNKRTKELIEKFMNEADSSKEPIRYEFVPVWTILQQRYTHTDHYYKAINLEAYYRGFKNYDCTRFLIDEQLLARKFVFDTYSTPDNPNYKCILLPKGCYSDHDCHWSYFDCDCQGDTCIKYKKVTRNDGITVTIPYANHEPDWAGQGCSYSYGCKCTDDPKTRTWTIVWSLFDAKNSRSKGQSAER